jgi:hypothetical protein
VRIEDGRHAGQRVRKDLRRFDLVRELAAQHELRNSLGDARRVREQRKLHRLGKARDSMEKVAKISEGLRIGGLSQEGFLCVTGLAITVLELTEEQELELEDLLGREGRIAHSHEGSSKSEGPPSIAAALR